jgi:formate-dependent nitrite reductase cytochrome c552 subunit
LVAVFALDPWKGQPVLYPIALVDPAFYDPKPTRKSYNDMVRAKEDLSDFDCYICHDKGKAPTLVFDAKGNLVIPEVHASVVMGHGTHNRNNLCYNCHDEANLTLLQTRDGRELKFSDSTQLCGSCHGPTYREWSAGVHGRTNGFWNRAQGATTRMDCVNCHNPHSPKYPGRKPAPGPRPLHAAPMTAPAKPAH